MEAKIIIIIAGIIIAIGEIAGVEIIIVEAKIAEIIHGRIKELIMAHLYGSDNRLLL
jgi:hypothetical protein